MKIKNEEDIFSNVKKEGTERICDMAGTSRESLAKLGRRLMQGEVVAEHGFLEPEIVPDVVEEVIVQAAVELDLATAEQDATGDLRLSVVEKYGLTSEQNILKINPW